MSEENSQGWIEPETVEQGYWVDVIYFPSWLPLVVLVLVAVIVWFWRRKGGKGSQ